MSKDKLIILVLLIIIVILTTASFAVMPNNEKQNSQININSNSTIYLGDTIEIILKDSNNAPISNQTIYVNIIGENNTNFNYSLKTDSYGIGRLMINQTEGNITVNCTFEGNDKYNANSTYRTIYIQIKEAIASQSNSSPVSSYSSSGDEPEFGSTDYVQKWDESQKGDGSWAYTHDQPVKTENGHEYKRMYNPDNGESYWYKMR